nr:hypothetical protein [Parvularcula marina]
MAGKARFTDRLPCCIVEPVTATIGRSFFPPLRAQPVGAVVRRSLHGGEQVGADRKTQRHLRLLLDDANKSILHVIAPHFHDVGEPLAGAEKQFQREALLRADAPMLPKRRYLFVRPRNCTVPQFRQRHAFDRVHHYDVRFTRHLEEKGKGAFASKCAAWRVLVRINKRLALPMSPRTHVRMPDFCQ